MKRHMEYRWRLREIMGVREMNNLTELIPQLHDRGVTLSASRTYRLLGATPERTNLTLLAALLHVLDCTFEGLCPSTVVATPTRHCATRTHSPGNRSSTAKPEAIRPIRARIHRPEGTSHPPPGPAPAVTAPGSGSPPPGPRDGSAGAATNALAASKTPAPAAPSTEFCPVC